MRRKPRYRTYSVQNVTPRPRTSRYRVKDPVRGNSMPPTYSSLWNEPQRRRGSSLVFVIAVVASLALGLFLIVGVPKGEEAPAPTHEENADQKPTAETVGNENLLEPLIVGQGMVTGSGAGRVSFCAVGDNVINQDLIDGADLAAGTMGDDVYDFTSLYAPVAPTITQEFDVAFINQETVLGGNDNFGYAGYPTYNSPDAVAEALAKSGFDVINCNSNHTYDIGADGIYHELELWEAYPELLPIGMFANKDEAQRIRMIERNGIKIAVLSYSYGLNGYEVASEGTFVHSTTGNTFDDDGSLVNFISETKLARDIPRAREVADAVVVSLHFGEEYSHTPDEYQRTWAQRCADLGADVVLGTHTHYIQPVEWIQGSSGNKCLVAWCLGDFASGYGRMDASLGGMLSFDFVTADDGALSIENLMWTPTIEHLENGQHSIYFLKDYSPTLASRNEQYTTATSIYNTTEMTSDIIGYAKTLNEKVFGDTLKLNI